MKTRNFCYCVLSVQQYDIDGSTGEEELAKLAECLNKASTAYSMEISAEKTKLMTNHTSGINTKIKVNVPDRFPHYAWTAA